MKKLIIFNWKLNPQRYSEAEKIAKAASFLARKTKKTEIIICPPFVYLLKLSSLISHLSLLKLGAQDVFWEEEGAYTGEISPAMLKQAKIDYVIVGHSERRHYLKETDEMINKKVISALKSGLKVILCVGEDLKIRRRGKKAVMNFIKNQLEKDLIDIENLKFKIENLVVAYEPIWAIGTGIPATPEDALEIIKFIKSLLVTRWSLVAPVLYGGSVNGKNIESFLKYKEINGALVGGASLNPKQFNKIIN